MIGSGNAGTVVGKLLKNAGHAVIQVFSRNYLQAKTLAEELGAAAVSKAGEISKQADVYIVAIADDELSMIKNWLVVDDQLIVHTAGSVSIDVLKGSSNNFGVLYPLQTLRKEVKVITDIPFLVDGNTENSRQLIFSLGRSISENVQFADDAVRKKLHLAAVMINNFPNHLFALTEAYCIKEEVDFKLLWPLISEGALRIRQYSPSELQTGPAIRNDRETIEKQVILLQQYPELLKIYMLFTESILSLKKQILPLRENL
jgi:predicted short-subunit dehydrogenase-like oxidoreductase (DUF2520 family)